MKITVSRGGEVTEMTCAISPAGGKEVRTGAHSLKFDLKISQISEDDRAASQLYIQLPQINSLLPFLRITSALFASAVTTSPAVWSASRAQF